MELMYVFQMRKLAYFALSAAVFHLIVPRRNRTRRYLRPALVFFILLGAAIFAVGKDHETDQLVLVVYSDQADRLILIPKNVYIVAKAKKDAAHLPPKSFLLCRLNNVKDDSQIAHITLQCGADTFLVTGLGVTK
jgi:hypothetical protein